MIVRLVHSRNQEPRGVREVCPASETGLARRFGSSQIKFARIERREKQPRAVCNGYRPVKHRGR